MARREEFAALLAGVRGEIGDHVFICVTDDIGGAQLAGTQIQFMEIFQQIAERGVLLLHVTKIDLRIEVDGTEDVAELAAVVFLDMGQGDVDLLADFMFGPVVIQIIERGFLIDREPLAPHGAFHTLFIATVLLHVLGLFFFRDVA